MNKKKLSFSTIFELIFFGIIIALYVILGFFPTLLPGFELPTLVLVLLGVLILMILYYAIRDMFSIPPPEFGALSGLFILLTILIIGFIFLLTSL